MQGTEFAIMADSYASAPPWKTVIKPHVRARLGKNFNEQDIEKISETLAVPPRCTSVRVNTVACSREQLIIELQAELDKRVSSPYQWM
jgi:hypothetical protein